VREGVVVREIGREGDRKETKERGREIEMELEGGDRGREREGDRGIKWGEAKRGVERKTKIQIHT